MKQILLICAVVALVGGCASAPKVVPSTPKVIPNSPKAKEESAKVIEAAIRKELKKPKGELTEADLEKVTRLVRDGYLYGVADAGIAYCWKSDTGKEMWKGRLGGTFSASLTLVNDRLYAANEAGECFVFEASTKGFNLIAKNQLGDEIFATPVICGNRLYQRVAHRDGLKRQEMLYCIKP